VLRAGLGRARRGIILNVRLPIAACLAALLASTVTAHAEPKRPVPDYDGRGNPDADSGSWPLWIPRILLSPVYVAHEYLLRRPLGAFVTKAERDHWADSVEEIFTFGPKGNNVIYPTALFDFGLLPSVGVYYAGEDFLAADNTLRVHAATWGRPWISATIADHYAFDSSNTIQARFDFRRAEDNIFFGIGPDVRSNTESRFGLEKAEASLSYHMKIPGRESRLQVWGGVHRLTPVEGTCCANPSVGELVEMGQLARPPGFGETYTAAFGALDVLIDSRAPKPAPGSGAFLHAWAEPSKEIPGDRAWIQYGSVVGESLDLTGNQRVIKMQVAVDFLDQLAGMRAIPFTEYPILDGDLMPGFVPGWLRGQSTAAAQLGYTWPVWIGFDGQTRVTLGNAYGPHLDGLMPGKFRWSWDIGLTTNARRDQGFELLFGLGSETFDQGAGITSVRVSIGSRQGF